MALILDRPDSLTGRPLILDSESDPARAPTLTLCCLVGAP